MELTDLFYLQMHYQLKFLFFYVSKLEKILLENSFEEISEKLVFNEEINDLLKGDYFVVSQRP